MILIKITHQQGEKFAERSGDINKIHLDENYAKYSLFGETICHGCNSLIEMLKRIDKNQIESIDSKYLQIKYTFHKPVFYEETHQLITTFGDDKSLKLDLVSNESNSLKINLNICRYETRERVEIESNPYSSKNLELPMEIINEPIICGVLRNSSYVIGMINPGAKSLYLGGKVICLKTDILDPKTINEKIKVEIGHNRGLIRKNLATTNSGIKHEFQATLRPEYKHINPVLEEENLLEDSKKLLPSKMYHYILGGTSGIAKEIIRLLKKKNENYRYIIRDKLHDKKAIYIEDIEKFSIKSLLGDIDDDICIYYFISSRIFPDSFLTRKQKNELEKTQFQMPVAILSEARTIIEKTKQDKKILFIYPSTIFIEDEKNKKEYSFYVKLKEKAEKKLTEISNTCSKLDVILPRLKQSYTRQNISLMGKININANTDAASLIMKDIRNSLNK